MAHSEILTASEYATWQPNQLILQFIRTSQQEMGVSLEDFRILDWGCGRGLAEVTKVFSDHGLLAQPYMNDCLPVSFRERIGMELDTMQILTRRV